MYGWWRGFKRIRYFVSELFHDPINVMKERPCPPAYALHLFFVTQNTKPVYLIWIEYSVMYIHCMFFLVWCTFIVYIHCVKSSMFHIRHLADIYVCLTFFDSASLYFLDANTSHTSLPQNHSFSCWLKPLPWNSHVALGNAPNWLASPSLEENMSRYKSGSEMYYFKSFIVC